MSALFCPARVAICFVPMVDTAAFTRGASVLSAYTHNGAGQILVVQP